MSVHQVVRDPSGQLLVDQMVHHVYELQDAYVRRMEIRQGRSQRPGDLLL